MAEIAAAALDQLFREARTQYDWTPEPVPDETLRRLHDILIMGPTSANCLPMRVIFCKSDSARARLSAAASGNNQAKILQAPVTAIIGYDLAFADHLPTLFPHTDAKSWFEGKEQLTRDTAFRNSSLQGAYLIVVARALGLDAGPMSGFDKAAVDAAFWAGTRVETNFICSLGTGSGKGVFPRNPRFAFDEICTIA